MMNAQEQEYMDYLIHNRTQLTIEIGRHLDELLLLQKKLDIATKALKEILKDYEINGPCEEDCVGYYMRGIAAKALKEIDLIGTSVSSTKEEQ